MAEPGITDRFGIDWLAVRAIGGAALMAGLACTQWSGERGYQRGLRERIALNEVKICTSRGDCIYASGSLNPAESWEGSVQPGGDIKVVKCFDGKGRVFLPRGNTCWAKDAENG